MATNRTAAQANVCLLAARKHLREVLVECAKLTDAAVTELRQAEIALRLVVGDRDNWK